MLSKGFPQDRRLRIVGEGWSAKDRRRIIGKSNGKNLFLACARSNYTIHQSASQTAQQHESPFPKGALLLSSVGSRYQPLTYDSMCASCRQIIQPSWKNILKNARLCYIIIYVVRTTRLQKPITDAYSGRDPGDDLCRSRWVRCLIASKICRVR